MVLFCDQHILSLTVANCYPQGLITSLKISTCQTIYAFLPIPLISPYLRHTAPEQSCIMLIEKAFQKSESCPFLEMREPFKRLTFKRPPCYGHFVFLRGVFPRVRLDSMDFSLRVLVIWGDDFAGFDDLAGVLSSSACGLVSPR
jgi:hypothetical protein